MPGVAWLGVAALLLLLAFLALFAASLILSALRRGGRREDPIAPDDAIAGSRFTLPVSIIVPVGGAAGRLSATISSLLALHYPQLEVIVVMDRLAAGQLETLKVEWELTPREFFYRRTIQTAAVRRIFHSDRDARLIVVEKDVADRADALNCGISLACLPYVAVVAADVILETNALLRLMLPALRAHAGLLAATCHIERRPIPRLERSSSSQAPGAWSALAHCQWIASIRSWVASRVTLRRLRCGLGPQDGVVAWRREELLAAGGFSVHAADPELEMLVRLQTSRDEDSIRKVVRTAEIVGRADPLTLPQAARLTSHRQRAVFQALKAFGRAPRGTEGRVPAICFFIAELLTPLVQAAVIVAVIGGAIVGSLPWSAVLFLLVMLSFGNAAITVSGLLLRGALPRAPTTAELMWLLVLSPAEYALYRPALALSRLATSLHAR
jgi:hypothetical protein